MSEYVRATHLLSRMLVEDACIKVSTYASDATLVEILTIILKQLDLPVSIQILIPEEDNPTLGDKRSKLIQLLLIELRELYTFQYSPDRLYQVNTLSDRVKRFLLRIGKESSIFRWLNLLAKRIRGCPITDLGVEKL